MNPIESSCPISGKTTSVSIEACQSLSPGGSCMSHCAIATPAGINAIAAALGARQQRETEVAALVNAAAAAARQAEVELHDAVMAMRDSVNGYLDANSTLNRD